MAQQSPVPSVEVQRAEMAKLGFLAGKWAGEARIMRGTGEPDVLMQTEEAQYKLDGLILLIEGIGRTRDGKPALAALGVVSYDDERKIYHMRAFNDGRFLETDVTLLDNERGITWGFALGQVTTSSVMRINEKGDWTEHTEIKIGEQPAKTYLELTVSRQK
jgi:hypothetical protein